MCDEQRRRVTRQLADRANDIALLCGVETGGRLVEDQDRRLANERACERDPLPLASGKRASPLAQHRVVAVGQLVEELVDTRRRSRRAHLLVARVGTPVANVLGDREPEQDRFLPHDRDLRAQRVEGEIAHVEPVDRDPALHGIVEPRNESDERRLSASRLADDRDRRAGPHLEVDTLEHGLVDCVCEVDTLEGDPALQRRGRRRRRAVGQLGLGVEHLRDPLGGCERLGGALHALRGPPQRAVRGPQVADEDGQLARRDRAV